MAAKKQIPPSDTNEIKIAEAVKNESTAPIKDSTALSIESKEAVLFDVSGIVEPNVKTDGATMPELAPAPEKRGRGRPAGSGKNKKTVKATPEQVVAVSTANAEMVVSALDLLRAAVSGGECPENKEMRGACVGTWASYLESEGMTLPPYVQVGIVSVMYVAPALATPKGKGLLRGTWDKIKLVYLSWRTS